MGTLHGILKMRTLNAMIRICTSNKLYAEQLTNFKLDGGYIRLNLVREYFVEPIDVTHYIKLVFGGTQDFTYRGYVWV